MPGKGPLPKGNARRTNAPTIATTELPAEGRTEKAPRLPKGYELGDAGKAWWRWAWKLPHADQWDAGSVYFVARRAELEDLLAARRDSTSLHALITQSLAGATADDLDDVLAGAAPDAIQAVEDVIDGLTRIVGALARTASGATSLMKEMRELDNRLGLNPKSMGELRWSIGERQPTVADAADDVTQLDDYRSRLG